MRCSKGVNGCHRRFTIKHPPAWYKHWPKCPHCGSQHTFSVEKAVRAARERQGFCKCPAYPFPHRQGGLRLCARHRLVGMPPTEDEAREYESVLACPRGEATWGEEPDEAVHGLGYGWKSKKAGPNDPPPF